MAIQVLPMVLAVGEEPGSRCVGEEEARRELTLLQSCESRHVLSCSSSVRHADQLWIVTELCEGGSLLDVMHGQRAPLSEVQVAAACGGALEGLRHLHARKMLHRDVKVSAVCMHAFAQCAAPQRGGGTPAAHRACRASHMSRMHLHTCLHLQAGNLLLTAAGAVKLGDLGISVQLKTTLARRMTVIGTPHWLAPEVIASEGGYDNAVRTRDTSGLTCPQQALPAHLGP